MSGRTRASKTPTTCKLDSKLYADKVRRAGEIARSTLDKYGQPAISLIELRQTLDRDLGGVSLAQAIIKEREAGL